MSQKLFREKNLEQISSPDHLTDYLKVTGPGVWLVLSGIILMLAGLLVWGTFGKIVTTVNVPAAAENRTLTCYVRTDDIDLKDPEIFITIGDVEMVADSSVYSRKTMDSSDNPALFRSGYLQPGQNVIVLKCECFLDNGIYEAEVTTETLHPISVLFAR